MFRMLGTPAADKSHIVLDTPHDVSSAASDTDSRSIERGSIAIWEE